MSSERNEIREEGKTERVPLGGLQLKMQLSDAERKVFDARGMQPRWVNDRDGRVARALSGGYNFVDPKYAQSIGNQAIDGKVSMVVTKGNDLVMSAHLMEIKKKFFNEDQKRKQDKISEDEKSLIAGNAGGANVENPYGSGVTFTR